jgi:glycosyltransferase involved in cell wall biosynthesis
MNWKGNGLSRKIRGVIVSTHDNLYPNFGGGALRTIKAAEEFKRRGLDVLIVAPARTDQISDITVHWLHPPVKHRSQIYSTIKFTVRLTRKFLQYINQADMYFVHNTIAAITLPIITKISGRKFALDITDIHVEYLPIGKRSIFEKAITPLLYLVEYWIIKSAHSVTVATDAMRDHIISKGVRPERVKVVYDGAETKIFSAEKEQGSNKNIIHLGTIDRQHGVEYLIQAIPHVLAKHPEARFYVVGGGREYKNVVKLSKNLGVYDSCVFTDYLPTEKARTYLKKCGIGVIPRDDNLANRIVTTLKIYEYWASGTAVVSSGLAGVKEIGDDSKNILFFEPGNVKDFANKIIYLLENQRYLKKLQENSLIKVKDFDWPTQIKKIIDFALKQ